ncbi:MAG: HutD family protein [Proteobacteria bacterium]|nr:HutD family protein [Pseudomonadota bacterium]
MHLLPAAQRKAVPWKNGGGKTWEIAAFPPGAGMDDFGWRISTAEVAAAGPFSNFGQVDRILTVIEGRLELYDVVQGQGVILEAGQSHAFAGDTPIEGRPLGGPVRDLNVMVRRGVWTAQVSLDRPPHLPAATVMAIARRASAGFNPLDAALLEGAAELPADFTGFFVCLRRFNPCVSGQPAGNPTR